VGRLEDSNGRVFGVLVAKNKRESGLSIYLLENTEKSCGQHGGRGICVGVRRGKAEGSEH